MFTCLQMSNVEHSLVIKVLYEATFNIAPCPNNLAQITTFFLRIGIECMNELLECFGLVATHCTIQQLTETADSGVGTMNNRFISTWGVEDSPLWKQDVLIVWLKQDSVYIFTY